ncbi:MAG TPA: tRNA lysidine(34) synthetase TilS [Solirubrobacterales bacterium]|jgi:tRNA(Ile)-lysidine synthase|nr:tRNA lysidine(34) synthetase TilS [Solirubrobacterales bacterium]
MIAGELLERIEAGGLLAGEDPLLVMLSGGRDSVCVLDLAVRVGGAEAVSALHVNYGLRGEADEDERHCARLCEELGVTLEVERASQPEEGGNLQAWAREVRYAAAARRAEAAGALILTGHTADDQVETILYRLASSPSRRALLGMRPRDGRLARPLLGTTREETTAYCEERELAWRDDASNEGDAYARNRIRRGLIPALAEIHPAAKENVLRTAALLREEAELLDALVDAELGGGEGVEAGTISHARFAELHPALRRLVLQRLADEAAGRPLAGAARFADQVAGLSRGGSVLDLGGGVRAVLEGGILSASLYI